MQLAIVYHHFNVEGPLAQEMSSFSNVELIVNQHVQILILWVVMLNANLMSVSAGGVLSGIDLTVVQSIADRHYTYLNLYNILSTFYSHILATLIMSTSILVYVKVISSHLRPLTPAPWANEGFFTQNLTQISRSNHQVNREMSSTCR